MVPNRDFSDLQLLLFLLQRLGDIGNLLKGELIAFGILRPAEALNQGI